jgi:hypothetical protein
MIKGRNTKRRTNLGGIKEVKWIMENDYYDIIKTIKATKLDGTGIILMESLMIKYVDAKCKICRHCPAQVKFGHKRLVNWWEKIGKHLKIRNELGMFVEKNKN